MLRRAWENLEEALLCLLLFVMVLITFVTVVTRYLFDIPLSYIDQLVPNLFVWVTFLGASAAVKRRAHLGLSAIYDAMPVRMRRFVDVAVLFGTSTFFAVTAWYGVRVVLLQMENRMMASLGYPSWVIGLAVPVGAMLFVIRSLEAWRRGRPPESARGPVREF